MEQKIVRMIESIQVRKLFFREIAFTAAYGGLREASGGRLASLVTPTRIFLSNQLFVISSDSECTLRIESFIKIGRGGPELQVGTHIRTDKR